MKTQEYLRYRWMLAADWLAHQIHRGDVIGDVARELAGHYPNSAERWMQWTGGNGTERDKIFSVMMREFNLEHPLRLPDDDATARAVQRALAGKPPRHRAKDPRSVGPKMRAYVMGRDNFRCRRCGACSRDEGVRLVIDHIVPVAKGGTNEPTNLQVLCGDCNAGKSDAQPHQHDLRPA